MALKYPIYPEPEYIFKKSQKHLTLISRFENRAEQRRSKWSQPYCDFSLKYKIAKKYEFWRLWEFYQLCRGAQRSFDFVDPTASVLPYENAVAYWPIHEAEGLKVNDWNGYLYPTYSCRFMEDELSFEEFSYRLVSSGINITQVSPIVFTNNYGTIVGAAWAQSPDGSACIDFDGIDDNISMGNVAALNVGAGDFSLAFGIYTDSLSIFNGVFSKKASDLASAAGYHLIIGTDGQITVRLADGTNQNIIVSALGAMTLQTWKIIAVIFDRDGNGQIYIDNAASGSPVTLTAVNADNAQNFYLGRSEGVTYGNFKMRNFIFARKVWTQAERDKIWAAWRGIFQI